MRFYPSRPLVSSTAVGFAGYRYLITTARLKSRRSLTQFVKSRQRQRQRQPSRVRLKRPRILTKRLARRRNQKEKVTRDYIMPSSDAIAALSAPSLPIKMGDVGGFVARERATFMYLFVAV